MRDMLQPICFARSLGKPLVAIRSVETFIDFLSEAVHLGWRIVCVMVARKIEVPPQTDVEHLVHCV